jgi:hypothetical protein
MSRNHVLHQAQENYKQVLAWLSFAYLAPIPTFGFLAFHHTLDTMIYWNHALNFWVF